MGALDLDDGKADAGVVVRAVVGEPDAFTVALVVALDEGDLGACWSCRRARSMSSASRAVRADRAELRALHHANPAPRMETTKAALATQSAAAAVGSAAWAASIRGA